MMKNVWNNFLIACIMSILNAIVLSFVWACFDCFASDIEGLGINTALSKN